MDAEENEHELPVITDYKVEIRETTTNGFSHPGVGLTKPILENVREQIVKKQEPWYSYYKAMSVSSSASKNVKSSNESSDDPTKPASDAFNSKGIQARFISDGLKAYSQSLLYYITGDEVYRANAMHIIRIWSQMDPSKYGQYQDDHIHTGIPLNRIVTAAEILRYTSSPTEGLEWTDQDTANFTNNLIMPIIDNFQYDNNHFMNQHNYPLLGAMAGYIFTNNQDRYQEAVEWFTVNKTAENQGYNGSIKQLFLLVDTNAETGEKLEEPVVQHIEMGRDQAHGGGDLTNSTIISRMLLAQNTKVDPEEGTVSSSSDSVGPYEFLNDRILKAADYFWKYMLGYETSWVPVPYVYDKNGEIKGTYYKLSDSYRGRMVTANFWDLYYYYTYEKEMDLAEQAPYYYEAFTKRIPLNYYYQGEFKQNWDNVDGGGDFWLYIPEEAKTEGDKFLPNEQKSESLVEIEERYTSFDKYSTTKEDEETSYIQFTPEENGSKIAVLNLSYADRSDSLLVGVKFRTNGTATIELSKEKNSEPYHRLTLPNTNGEWKYITYDMGVEEVSYGQLDKDYSLLYMNVTGDGTTVDVDHLNVKANEELTPPVFTLGDSDLNTVAYVGAPVSLDFSATDPAEADTISYQIFNKPDGSALSQTEGTFDWKPTEPGTYSFIVEASDGTTITTKKVKIEVADTRENAVKQIVSPYNPDKVYIVDTLSHYQQTYDSTMDQIDKMTNDEFYQQLGKLEEAVDELSLATPLLADGSMDYTKMVVNSNIGNSLSLLVDGNNNTYPVYSLAPEMNYILDFGPDFKVSASSFAMQGRMNFVSRMAGSAAFGSNDGTNWTRLTPGETEFINGMSSIEVDEKHLDEKYRFIKLEKVNPQPDVLHNEISTLYEPSELRIFGTRHETNNKLEAVSIGSDQSIAGRISIGDTVKLSIQAKEKIKNVQVKIQGLDASVNTRDERNWTAEATMNEMVKTGEVKFSIEYQPSDGTAVQKTFLTTDGSKLYLSDDSSLIDNITNITDLMDSTADSGRSESETMKQVGYLFDQDPSTNSDFRLNGSGSKSYITFDFKDGNQVVLSNVELLARQDRYYSRIKDAVVQGSNDNQTWVTLSEPASSTLDWQNLMMNSNTPYRYIRIYNPNNWYGNMAELRLHGNVNIVDDTPPTTTDNVPDEWVNKDLTIHLTASDAGSGIKQTYYKLNDGNEQTGNVVGLKEEGEHRLTYWSEDKAGNVEDPKTAIIKIDKSPPDISIKGLEEESFTGASSIKPKVTIDDSLSGIDDSKTKITLDNEPYQLESTIYLYKLSLGSHMLTIKSSDLAGNSVEKKITFHTFASIEGLKQLVTLFEENNWIKNHGIATSLQKKLNHNQLKSFIHAVKAQRGKQIGEEAADYLHRDANELME